MASRKSNVVDTWLYAHKSVEAAPDEEGATPELLATDKKVKVDIELEKEFDTSIEPPYPVKAVRFTARCRDPEIRITGTDIETIRKAVWATLDERYKITWEGWYLVRIRPSHGGDGSGSGLTFSYKDVEKGVAWDGSVLLREYDHHHSRNASCYKISPWPGAFRDQGGNIIACIPATPTNTAALEEFSRRIDGLRAKLADYLRPERILDTLSNLSGIALLAQPDGGRREDQGDIR